MLFLLNCTVLVQFFFLVYKLLNIRKRFVLPTCAFSNTKKIRLVNHFVSVGNCLKDNKQNIVSFDKFSWLLAKEYPKSSRKCAYSIFRDELCLEIFCCDL